MRFITASGSVYEVNTDSKKIRRLNGQEDPTPRTGKDGQWRGYKEIIPDPIKIGSGVAILWDADTALLAESQEYLKEKGGFALPTTVTSAVVEVQK